jgi:sensor domain CHASE-containing protein
LETLKKLLEAPQVQSAIIAAVISVIVTLLITHRSKRAAQALRAQTLLEVYNPIEVFLQKKSLYRYVSRNKPTLERNRPSFGKKILPLIDEAIREHYEIYRPDIVMGNAEPTTPEEEASMRKLDGIQKRLVPLLTREINRLRKIVDKG